MGERVRFASRGRARGGKDRYVCFEVLSWGVSLVVGICVVGRFLVRSRSLIRRDACGLGERTDRTDLIVRVARARIVEEPRTAQTGGAAREDPGSVEWCQRLSGVPGAQGVQILAHVQRQGGRAGQRRWRERKDFNSRYTVLTSWVRGTWT